MEDEDVVLLTLLKEEEKRCVRRKQQAKRGSGLGVPRRVDKSNVSINPLTKRRSENVGILPNNVISTSEYNNQQSDDSLLKRLQSHMAEEDRRSYIAAGLLQDDNEILHQSSPSLIIDEPEETNRSSNRQEEISPPTTPLARSLEFDKKGSQATNTTPGRSKQDITSEFVNIMQETSTRTEETMSALKQQLETSYSLIEHGNGCILTKVPDISPNRIQDVGDSDDSEFEHFSGEATISSIVNISDGMLQQIKSQNGTVESQSEAVVLSMSSTAQLLDELLKGLKYSAHVEIDQSSNESILSSSSHLDKENQTMADTISDLLVDLGNQLPEHNSVIRVLRSQLGCLPTPVNVVGGTDPHQFDIPNSKMLNRILGSLSELLQFSQNATTHSWCDTSDEETVGSLQVLKELLRDLCSREKSLKDEKKLEASANLRIQRISEQSKWLIETAVNTLPEIPKLRHAQAETSEFRSAADSLQDIKKSEVAALKQIDDGIQYKKTCLIAQRELVRKTEQRHSDETLLFDNKLNDNGRECQQVLDEITALNEKLANKFSERCSMVKNRVIDIGNNAMEYGREYEALQSCNKELRHTSDARKRLSALSQLSDVVFDLTKELRTIHQNWNADVASADTTKNNFAITNIKNVWNHYQTDHQNWSTIIQKSITAMETRKASLSQLSRDAEDRYDEDDVRNLQANLQHTKVKIINLNESLSKHNKTMLEVKHQIEEHTDIVLNSPIRHTTDNWNHETPSPKYKTQLHQEDYYESLQDEISPEEPSPGSVHMVSISPPMTSWCQSVPQISIEMMKKVLLSESLNSLDRDHVTIRGWIALLNTADVQTVADLLRIRTEPTVWDAFLPDKPLLKTELSLLLHRHVAAASQASAVV